MEEIIAEIEAALKRTGMSASAASRKAVNNPSLIKNLMNRRAAKGQPHPIENLKALAEVLGIEFYFGPPRISADVTSVDGERFATVPRYAVNAAAGGGHVNPDEEPIDHLAFSRDWMIQNGILPEKCILITAKGESMAPAISDGDLVMIDLRKTEIVSGKVYVYNDPNDGNRVKRLEVVPGAAIIVRSDNANGRQFAPEFHVGEEMNKISENVLGEVVWSGHTWR
ncbi:MAG: hypothetical protein HWE21_10855 [Cytophagia bacterium]|nr:hypothetical protein [Cytophagia bacterium]